MQRILNLNPQKEGKDTTDLETPIDIMAYKLYGLTYDEVKIVDSEFDNVLSTFRMSKEDYENKIIEELSNYDLTYPENLRDELRTAK